MLREKEDDQVEAVLKVKPGRSKQVIKSLKGHKGYNEASLEELRAKVEIKRWKLEDA